MAVVCPHCQREASRVLDSRPTVKFGQRVNRRRRQCKSCKEKFNTYEFNEQIADRLIQTGRNQLRTQINHFLVRVK